MKKFQDVPEGFVDLREILAPRVEAKINEALAEPTISEAARSRLSHALENGFASRTAQQHINHIADAEAADNEKAESNKRPPEEDRVRHGPPWKDRLWHVPAASAEQTANAYATQVVADLIDPPKVRSIGIRAKPPDGSAVYANISKAADILLEGTHWYSGSPGQSLPEYETTHHGLNAVASCINGAVRSALLINEETKRTFPNAAALSIGRQHGMFVDDVTPMGINPEINATMSIAETDARAVAAAYIGVLEQSLDPRSKYARPGERSRALVSVLLEHIVFEGASEETSARYKSIILQNLKQKLHIGRE